MKGSAKVRTSRPVEVVEDGPATLSAPVAEPEPPVSVLPPPVVFENLTEQEDDEEDQPGGEPGHADRESVKDKDKKEKEKPRKESPVLAAITQAEDQSLKDWLDAIGEAGAFQVRLNRTKPEYARDARGESISVAGFLQTYESPVSEEDIKREFGGGTYSLKVLRRNKNGSFVYAQGFHRTINIAGEPRIPATGTPAPITQSVAPTESVNAAVTRTAMEMVKDAYEKNASAQRGMDPAVTMLFDQLKDQNLRYERQLAALNAQLDTIRSTPPAEDPLKDKILSSLIGGESGRITSLEARHESELRQLKQSHIDDIKRIEERHDRAMADVRTQHDRQLDQMRSSFEREIAAMRTSNEVALASAKATSEVQVHTLAGEVKRLERDNGDLRQEVRELREKKDKSVLEQIKDAKTLKEALLDGEEPGESSTVAKIVDAVSSPAVIEAASKIFNRGPAPPTPAQAQAAALAAAPPRPQMVRTADGQVFLQTGNKLVPAKRKPKVITTDAGTQVEAPQMDPDQVRQLISYLEHAYANNQDPAILAQSSRSMVPDNVLAFIRENTTADMSGVDQFMRKVANLPGTSPLASLAGKTWLRKVGKALLGDTEE